MANENNTNAPRVPLNPDQQKARDAALAAARGRVEQKPQGGVKPVTFDHKPVTPQLAAMPGMTPLGVKPATDTPKPATPTTTGPAQTPISALVKAATTALSNTDNPAGADAAVAALATATAMPVNPAKVATVDPATAAHKAAIDKANANVGKGQGVTVAVTKAAAKAANQKAADANRDAQAAHKAAKAAVTAAKPVKLTPRETALANDKLVKGYDFSKWPKAMLAIMPTADVIDGVRSTNVLKTLITKTELALCVYAMPGAQRFNVYDVATALQNVLGGSHDHKMNTVNQKAVPSGMWVRLNPAARAVGLTDGKNLIAYAVGPSAKGLIKIMAALGDKTPKHCLPENGQGKPADKGKGTPATGTPAGA